MATEDSLSGKLLEQLDLYAGEINRMGEADIEIKNKFYECFEKLYIQCIEDNFYWQYCPFVVYKDYIEKKCSEFLKLNPDGETQFYEDEYEIVDEYFIDEGYRGLDIEVLWFDSWFYYYLKWEYGIWSIPLKYLSHEMEPKLKQTQSKKIHFLHSKMGLLPTQNNEEHNPQPRIFKDVKSFELFQYLHKNLVRKRTQLADYSFIFRYMQKDGYIYEHTPESEFRNFLLKEYEIEIDKLKLIGYCETESKINFYSSAINLLKINRNNFQNLLN